MVAGGKDETWDLTREQILDRRLDINTIFGVKDDREDRRDWIAFIFSLALGVSLFVELVSFLFFNLHLIVLLYRRIILVVHIKKLTNSYTKSCPNFTGKKIDVVKQLSLDGFYNPTTCKL